MKSFLILVIACATCAYGVHAHFIKKEDAITASAAKKNTLRNETEKARTEAAALGAELAEKTKRFEAESIAVPARELEKARAEEQKNKAAAAADLEAAKRELETARQGESATEGTQPSSPEAGKLAAECAALETAIAQIEKENLRMRPVYEQEKILADKVAASKAARAQKKESAKLR